MGIDKELLAAKLKSYRNQFKLSFTDISNATGISERHLQDLEKGTITPTGDEILIIADFYKCDYMFFISNERIAPFEQTEKLFRSYGDDFSVEDRWSVQEVLFLAECDFFLDQVLQKGPGIDFTYEKTGTYYKGHGIDAAASLRKKLGYTNKEISLDVFRDYRRIGIRVFRRQLRNSNISGLYIKHPKAGRCILINYSEDIYRQRFTAAHEAAHAILGKDEDVVVSFTKWNRNDLKEIRANTFASNYLMPKEFLQLIPKVSTWNKEKAIYWAGQMKVSTASLAIALKTLGLIDANSERLIRSVKVPREFKIDPELSGKQSPRSLQRKAEMMKRGLDSDYVNRCISAYKNGIITANRMAEMLLSYESQLRELTELFAVGIDHGY